MAWFAYDIDEYDADTMHLSALEDGVYMRLLRFYYKTRLPLPDDDRALANIARVPLEQWEAIKGTIRAFFKPRRGKLHQKRCDRELDNQDSRSNKRSRLAEATARKRWGATTPAEGRIARSQRLSAARAKATHTRAEWLALVEICGAKCLRCGSTENIVKDHIVPISKGGSDGIENLQPLCAKCNSAKGSDSSDLRPVDALERLRNACEMPAERLETPATRQDKTDSEAIASAADAAKVKPEVIPFDTKAAIFGEQLAWLRETTARSEKSLRSWLGQCCGKYGDAAVLAAVLAIRAHPTPVDPISRMRSTLERQEGRVNGRHALTPAESLYAGAALALAERERARDCGEDHDPAEPLLDSSGRSRSPKAPNG